VSKATLERQQAQREALQAHRATLGGGHAPRKRALQGALGGAGGGWSEVAGYRQGGPAHVASGGPMDAANDPRARNGKHRGQAI
jgi:hypothetical protein